MALHDGNGWVECRCGQRHWGRHGAAGLLIVRPITLPAGGAATVSLERPSERPAGERVEVLLQLRAAWTHQGGSWALPGGARDSHEDAVAAALREAHEETGLSGADLAVVGEHPGIEHVDWSYTYVIALAHAGARAVARTSESDELRWVQPDEVSRLPLHPGFGAVWPTLRLALAIRP